VRTIFPSASQTFNLVSINQTSAYTHTVPIASKPPTQKTSNQWALGALEALETSQNHPPPTNALSNAKNPAPGKYVDNTQPQLRRDSRRYAEARSKFCLA